MFSTYVAAYVSANICFENASFWFCDSKRILIRWKLQLKVRCKRVEEDSLATKCFPHRKKEEKQVHNLIWEKQWPYAAEKQDVIEKDALTKKLGDYSMTQ
jgi:hypothetical protein